MITMHRRMIACFTCLMIIVSLVCLTGCSMHNSTLDHQTAQVVEYLNADMPDELYGLFYPGMTREEFGEVFENIRNEIPTLRFEEMKLRKIRVEKNTVHREKNKTTENVYEGSYYFDYDNKGYYLTIVYVETESESGIYTMEFSHAVKTGTLLTIMVIAIAAAEIGIVIFAVVDIIRKKPNKYVLWIILVIVLNLIISYRDIRFAIPIGCIIYFVRRRKLLTSAAKTE